MDVAEGRDDELEDYEIKERVLPRFAYMADWLGRFRMPSGLDGFANIFPYLLE